MTSHPLDSLTALGIAATKAGDRAEARRLFEIALTQDEKNVTAWWWLAQILDEPSARHKCLDRARGIASQSDQGLAIYRSLLQESGTSLLPLYRLVEGSKSVGNRCPIDTEALKVGDTIVICPKCGCAHHLDCWEYSAYHCGNYACDGSGLVERNGRVAIEAAATSKGSLVLDDKDIPVETPWRSREEQEAGFVDKLRQRAAEMMAISVIRQAVMEERARQIRQAREARARQEAQERLVELTKRTALAFLAGLIPGIILAIATFRYSQSWAIAIFTVYLTANSIATATGHALQASDRTTSIIYWFLPQAAAALILFATFEQWRNGLMAVILAYVGGIWLANRILQARPVYERRAFIAYSVLAITGLFILRSVLTASR